MIGKGTHASKPHQGTDPILAAARVVETLNTIVSRRVDPLLPAVVSVCHIQGGTNANIIPESVEMEGTVRYLDPALIKEMPAYVEQTVRHVCAANGARGEVEYDQRYIPTINDGAVVALAKDVAQKVLGAEAWIDQEHPSMGGEDFSFYLKKYPGAMCWLGMGEGGEPIHNPSFDFNDAALRNGILFLVAMALRKLA